MKKNRIKRTLAALCMLVFCSGALLFSQENCSVLVKELEGSYAGDCKKGMAHGMGQAQGIDSYKGRFSKGLPHGTGTYTWSDGRIYEGEWSKGLRDGEGTMTYPIEGKDSVSAGLWKDDIYKGKIVVPAYKVTRTSGVARSSITKSSDVGSGFRLGITLAGRSNSDLEDFSMVCGSGSEYQSGSYYGIQDAAVPYSVMIRYRTWNNLHSTQHDVVFEFTINEPGSFEVSLSH
jgi:hypothetical protein